MVQFPERKKLPKLKKANLTYPYHCCALNAEYGFGNLYKNEELYDKDLIRYNCDTGNMVLSPQQWWNDADINAEPDPIKVVPNTDVTPIKTYPGKSIFLL